MKITKHFAHITNHFYFVSGNMLVDDVPVQYSCLLDYHYMIQHSDILIAYENELPQNKVLGIRRAVIAFLMNHYKL